MHLNNILKCRTHWSHFYEYYSLESRKMWKSSQITMFVVLENFTMALSSKQSPSNNKRIVKIGESFKKLFVSIHKNIQINYIAFFLGKWFKIHLRYTHEIYNTFIFYILHLHLYLQYILYSQ